MKRTIVACAVLFCLYLLPSVAGAQGSVVVGQTPNGQNQILQVIELKYLDPIVAVQLLEALGYGGQAVPLTQPSLGPGYGAPGRNSANRPGYGNRNSRGNRFQDQDGYQGYQDANRRSDQYQGYQSPYDYR